MTSKMSAQFSRDYSNGRDLKLIGYLEAKTGKRAIISCNTRKPGSTLQTSKRGKREEAKKKSNDTVKNPKSPS